MADSKSQLPVSTDDVADNAEASGAFAETVSKVKNAIAAAGGSPGGGAIDMVNTSNYKWTLNTSSEARALAPRININLLEMRTGQLIQLLSQTVNLLTDPYNGLYSLEFRKRLTLPFFSDQHHDNSSTWEPLSLGSIGDIMGGSSTIGQIGAAVAGAAQMARGLATAFIAPAYKTETANVWRDTNKETISFSFNLYNTGKEEYELHKSFIDEMVYWTLPRKLQATFAIPPVLCEYDIPGIRRGLMAALDFAVTTKGQSVCMGGINVPDAYSLTFTLRDLLMQTTNINPRTGSGAMGGDIIGSMAKNVYTPCGPAIEAIGKVKTAVESGVNGIMSLVTGK